MMKSNLGKLLLAASAAAGFALLSSQLPAKAQTAEEPLASVPAAPEAGGACDFSKYRSSWDPAQCNSASSIATQSSITDEAAAATVPGVAEPEEGGSCDFGKYRSSWDPTHC